MPVCDGSMETWVLSNKAPVNMVVLSDLKMGITMGISRSIESSLNCPSIAVSSNDWGMAWSYSTLNRSTYCCPWETKVSRQISIERRRPIFQRWTNSSQNLWLRIQIQDASQPLRGCLLVPKRIRQQVQYVFDQRWTHTHIRSGS